MPLIWQTVYEMMSFMFNEKCFRSSFRYLLTPSLEEEKETFSLHNWKRLEERNIGYGDRSLFLPGGGFTKSLYLDWCVKSFFFWSWNRRPYLSLLIVIRSMIN